MFVVPESFPLKQAGEVSPEIMKGRQAWPQEHGSHGFACGSLLPPSSTARNLPQIEG